MSEKPALLLLPNVLGDHAHSELFLPKSVARAVSTIDGLIAESEKEGRRYLSRFETKKPALEIPIALFNEHTPPDSIDFFLEPIVAGERWGLVSDAGLPCIADPGSKLVLRARQRGITVQAFVGPSSILLALMLSGLPGQKFFFQGYLDRDLQKRKRELVLLADMSAREEVTQLFIEAPYRNAQALECLLQSLPDHALLSVGWDLTLPTQGVLTQTIQQWKKCSLPNLEKKPAIFLFFVPQKAQT
jgi:16S rRNA (cytidine1402-2'-O)-methyltransferase